MNELFVNRAPCGNPNPASASVWNSPSPCGWKIHESVTTTSTGVSTLLARLPLESTPLTTSPACTAESVRCSLLVKPASALITTDPLTRTLVAVTDPPGWTRMPSATTSVRVRLSPANTSTQPTLCGLATVGPVLEAVGKSPPGGGGTATVVVVAAAVGVVGAVAVLPGG